MRTAAASVAQHTAWWGQWEVTVTVTSEVHLLASIIRSLLTGERLARTGLRQTSLRQKWL